MNPPAQTTSATLSKPPSKSELAEELEKIVKRLRHTYLSQIHERGLAPIDPEEWAQLHRKEVVKFHAAKPSPAAYPHTGQYFPSRSDMEALTECISRLGSAIGIARRGFTDQYSVLRRLDHDYPRLKLVKFARDLAQRVASLPVPPCTKLAKLLAGKLSEGDRQIISDLYVLLGGRPGILGNDYRTPGNPQKVDWGSYQRFLVRLTSPSFNKLMPQQGALVGTSYVQLALRDVMCQQELWRSFYSRDIENTFPWLYLLLDPKIDACLRVVLHGSTLEPEVVRKSWRKRDAAQRSRRYRERKESRKKAT